MTTTRTLYAGLHPTGTVTEPCEVRCACGYHAVAPTFRDAQQLAQAHDEQQHWVGVDWGLDQQQQQRRERADMAKRARNVDLPGMDDRRIKALDEVAASYADIRDRRIELTREESELKQHAITLMHKHDKTIYKHDGIEIRLVLGEEDVKVKVKKDDDDAPDDAAPDEVEMREERADG